MTTPVKTLWSERVNSLTVRFLIKIMFILTAIKSLFISNFKSNMINKILHSWSFHMKFIKLAKDSFYKFYINTPLVLDSLYPNVLPIINGLDTRNMSVNQI